MKKTTIIILVWSISGVASANDKLGEVKSSATIRATCSISADTIGFGVVSTPLVMQNSQSEMKVLCSNKSAYTIELAYGGIYGIGGGDSEYIMKYSNSNPGQNYYRFYDSKGFLKGIIGCGFWASTIGQVYFNNVETAKLYGYNNSGWQADYKHTGCITNDTREGTYPVNWVGAYDATTSVNVGGTSYAYGVMNGMSKGDKVAYSIAVPGDLNKVWNKGNSSYQATGSGIVQNIPMIAKILPDKSASRYPAPDMYLDTVTAVISY